jgi:uncharacterized membrane protein
MANGTITFENKNTGAIKVAPVGFSWTSFFFSGIPALMRGHIGMGVIQIILSMISFSFSNIVFGFIYNKMYIKHMISEGAKMSSATLSDDALKAKLGLDVPKA